MLPTEHRLRKKKEIDAVFKKGTFFRLGPISAKVKNKKNGNTRFAFAVSKKISKKAVDRNYVKRQLREITRELLPSVKDGYDVMVMTLPGVQSLNYHNLQKTLKKLYKKAQLL